MGDDNQKKPVDIDKFKQVEIELRVLNATLEQRVAQQTAQLEAEFAERKRIEAALETQHAFLRQIMDVNPNFIFAKDRVGRFTLANRAVAEAYDTTVEELIGKTNADFLSNPEEVNQFHQANLEVMDSLQDKFIPEQAFTDATGRRRYLQTVIRPLVDNRGRADQIFGVSTDITARKQVEELLEIRVNQQLTVAQLGHQALSGAGLSELMDDVVTWVAQTLNVEYCKILELLPDKDVFLVRAGVGWHKGVVGRVTVEAGDKSQAGYTLLSNQPVIVTNLQAETRFIGMPILHDHEVVSGMTVIIPGPKRPFGILGAHSTQRRLFTQDDAHFLQSVANVLAAAIERKRVEEALQLSRDQLTVILQNVAEGITAQDPSGRLIYANDAAARALGYPSAQILLETPLTEVMQKFEILDESGRAFPLHQLPGRLALQGDPDPSALMRFRVVDTGEERWSDVKARPVFNEQGQVELAVNIFHDITRLKRAEQAQRILAEASQTLAASVDYESRLSKVAQLAVPDLADWCAVDVIELDETVRQLTVAHTDPAKMALAREFRQRYPPDWNAPSGVANVLRTGQSELYPEINDDMLVAAAKDAKHLRILRELSIKSAMIVPLITRGRILGAMTFVGAESGHRYRTDDLRLAEELARRAALAIDNARLYAEAQQLNATLEQRVEERTAQLQATNTKLKNEIAERKQMEAELKEVQSRLMESREAERVHLAQELHDGPLQELHGMSFRLGELETVMSDESSVGQMAATQAALQQVIKTLRAICGELRPPALAPFGLEKAIRSHAQNFQKTYPELSINLDLTPDGQALAEQTRLALFRIYQQALNNVKRHAKANQVTVRLKLDSEQAILEVKDNGCGFQVPQRRIELARQGHLGLVGAAERAEALGGQLEVISSPQQGTLIRAIIPRFKMQEESNC